MTTDAKQPGTKELKSALEYAGDEVMSARSDALVLRDRIFTLEARIIGGEKREITGQDYGPIANRIEGIKQNAENIKEFVLQSHQVLQSIEELVG